MSQNNNQAYIQNLSGSAIITLDSPASANGTSNIGIGTILPSSFVHIDLPLAAPGIVVGCLLSFVLAAGAVAESKILGGQAVITIADDIETAFTFGQDWPVGSALSMLLIVIIGALALFGISRVDLDQIMGRRR